MLVVRAVLLRWLPLMGGAMCWRLVGRRCERVPTSHYNGPIRQSSVRTCVRAAETRRLVAQSSSCRGQFWSFCSL